MQSFLAFKIASQDLNFNGHSLHEKVAQSSNMKTVSTQLEPFMVDTSRFALSNEPIFRRKEDVESTQTGPI